MSVQLQPSLHDLRERLSGEVQLTVVALRKAIAALLTISIVTLALPRTARADEEEAPSLPPRIMLLPSEAIALADAHANRLGPLGYFAAPSDIRLSRGAKTAIIVGAIVGGVLLIVGVIALAKPKPLFK